VLELTMTLDEVFFFPFFLFFFFVLWVYLDTHGYTPFLIIRNLDRSFFEKRTFFFFSH